MIQLLQQFFIATAILAGIPLLAAAIFGLTIALVQALTQIQDQTLPQLVKVAAVGAVLLLGGRELSGPLMSASASVFDTFWQASQ